MRTAPIERHLTVARKYTCAECMKTFNDYKNLVTHLFWRHGTESSMCTKCPNKRWLFAHHICNVLPIGELMFEDEIVKNNNKNDDNNNVQKRDSEYCYCGKNVAEEPMIGCDGPKCELQWYHFSCVGISEPPDGDWWCATCSS